MITGDRDIAIAGLSQINYAKALYVQIASVTEVCACNRTFRVGHFCKHLQLRARS
jgi:hypothetical protein